MEKTKSKIRELRVSKNLTQQQLADELHVTKQAISKWEKGKSIPDITSIELLSSFFGVSVDYLINDDVEEVKTKMAGTSSKRINKLSVILISALVFMTAVVIALSITLGVLLNNDKSDTIAVNGFEITYLSDETYAIDEDDMTVSLRFCVYNTTDYAKWIKDENFSLDNRRLYILPFEQEIDPREELKITIRINAYEELGALQQRSVTVKYAGREVAEIEW